MAIGSVDELRAHLQWAIQLEHATIPPYLCALYSIEEGRNPEATETILSVFVEEMLHLTLAANVLNAVGGSPAIDTPDILPAYPAYLPHCNDAFRVPLAKFSPASLETFMQIERPLAHDGLPADDRYETIGQFYAAIEEALVRLAGTLGEAALFSGDPARQVTDALYYGGSGRIIAVTDLASSLAALREIVDEGEGAHFGDVWDGERDMFHPERQAVAHYFRFQELQIGRRYQPGDTPASGPSGPPRPVDWAAVHNMRSNPRSADYPEGSEVRTRLEEFNHAYCGVLHLLQACFDGSPQLLRVATGEMYALREQAIALMRLPSGDGETTAGPSFEYVTPARRRWTTAASRRIRVTKNGPYVVYGRIPLVRQEKIVADNPDPNGFRDALTWQRTERLETEDIYALCRCGQSAQKPFCDGTHARIGFDGTETADPRPTRERREVLEGGTGIVVRRDHSLCMHAAFCGGNGEQIPGMLRNAAEPDVRVHIVGRVEHCPSGSYTYARDLTGPDIEPDFEARVAVTAEEGTLAGALWVTGGIRVERADGAPFEARNRVTLCRCGQSKNKPLCDGSHRKVGFKE